MPFTVAKIIHDITDWTHAEIVALEAHLGIHPNRKPAEPAPKPAETEVADPDVQKVVNGLENKLGLAEAEIATLNARVEALYAKADELIAELSAANASLAGATEANTQLQQQVIDLKDAIAASTEGKDAALQAAADAGTAGGAPVTTAEAAAVGAQQPQGDEHGQEDQNQAS